MLFVSWEISLPAVIPHRFLEQIECVFGMMRLRVIQLVEERRTVEPCHQMILTVRDGLRKYPLQLLIIRHSDLNAARCPGHIRKQLPERARIQINDLLHLGLMVFIEIAAIAAHPFLVITKTQLFMTSLCLIQQFLKIRKIADEDRVK